MKTRKIIWKITPLVLAIALVFSAAGCGHRSGKTEDTAADTTAEYAAAASTASEKADEAETAEKAEAAGTGEQAREEYAGAAETAAADDTGAQAAEEAMPASRGLIVIDPGHQQYGDPDQEPVGPGASETKARVSGGTSGVSTGVPEYQLTLEMGLKLRDELEDRGYTVLMTRETSDVDISNSERAAAANEADADAFVRIHANGSGDSSVTGAMTICQTPSNPYNGDLYEASRALSDCILDAYTRETGIRYEQVWETDTMSGINWSRVPVTILEMGYMSNSGEDVLMQDPDMQQRMTEGIADGIDAFMELYPSKHAGSAAEYAGAGRTEGSGTAAARSLETDALDRDLREKLEEKDGSWSLYFYRFDTDEEIGINANDPMVSASLIKLYVAGCYLEQVEKGSLEDEHQDDLFLMLSASDNDAANRLIDLLGMDAVNAFTREHRYLASHLNRKMLENNGKENYTSSEDCGKVLRAVYEGTYVSRDASNRVMEAMQAQIGRNRDKIPAGVPEGIRTANKTGELFVQSANGGTAAVQNDAAVIFADTHPYVLVVMSSVPGAGEAELHAQIQEISREIFQAVDSEWEKMSSEQDGEETRDEIEESRSGDDEDQSGKDQDPGGE